MTGLSIRSLVMALCLSVASWLAPDLSSALLLGDFVTATLEDLTVPGATIFSATVMVTVDPEFDLVPFVDPTFPGSQQLWGLDISDAGFNLIGSCDNDDPGCASDGLRLTLSGLDFTPPGSLVGLLGPTVGGDNFVVSGTVVTASSVVITFESFTLGTGEPLVKSFAARFDVQPPSAVPVPGSLLLMLVGGLALGAFVIRRPRR